MENAFSIDVEDWFSAYNFSEVIAYDQWSTCESRVECNTNRILELLDRHGVQGTFFVLGWVGERTPGLIKRIAEAGHEIATHGFSHRLVKNMKPEEFEKDLVMSLDAIRAAVDTEVIGFRAPSFSVDPEKAWVYRILAKHGIRYDSSIFPMSINPDYGNSESPLEIHTAEAGITEFPMSCFKFAGRALPCSGGGYFRLLPYSYTSYGIRQCNKEGRPVVFYLHPWEIDSGQPRVNNVSLTKRLRHYLNRDRTEKRLSRLLGDFEFGTVRSVLGL